MKTLLLYLFFILLIVGCEREIDKTFLITKESIGKLNRNSLARDLEIIYGNDSIVKDSTYINTANNSKKVKVFEKGGNTY